ncbi:replication-relaxation family protein [Streptomyces sp. NPDC060005]|uniref:replication-relaxation family protein n=1 Tax=Streptomyces sp. NPDC060005 TaxID=3347034 RepID=UPI003693EAD4
MNRPEQKRPAPRTSSESLRHQALAALAQHRIATSGHLHQMLCPLSTRQVMSRVLSKLRTHAFIDRTTPPEADRSHTKTWYLPPHGARLTRDLPVLRGRQSYPITSDTAASLKTSHTRAVVRAHLAIAADARQRGHKHGPPPDGRLPLSVPMPAPVPSGRPLHLRGVHIPFPARALVPSPAQDPPVGGPQRRLRVQLRSVPSELHSDLQRNFARTSVHALLCIDFCVVYLEPHGTAAAALPGTSDPP